MTQIELAKRSGLNQSTISDLEVGKSQGSTSLATIAAAMGVSALWLETGKGPMQAGDAAEAPGRLPPGMLFRVQEPDDEDDGYTEIPMVKLRLSAGISGYEVEPERFAGGTARVPKDWLARTGFTRDHLIAVRVRGESMEPALYEDDLVVINTRDTKPVDGQVFAVNYEGEPVIKRLSRDAGRWWLMSDNPDQRKFHKKVCEGDACIIVGRIVRKESERI